MRGKQTVRDMVLSMAVIGAFSAVIYMFIPHGEPQDPVKPVGYKVELDTARRSAPYPVAAPVGLPRQWRATSVRYDAAGEQGRQWHLGFMDPTNEYVAVEQSDGKPADFIAEVSLGARKTGATQRIGDAVWQRYDGEKYDALVRTERGVTTVVTGTAPYGRLATMAAALRAS